MLDQFELSRQFDPEIKAEALLRRADRIRPLLGDGESNDSVWS
jgi:hypothetical protein